MSIIDYQEALKAGRKEYQMCVARGKYPYLNVLEEILSNFDIESEIPLGTVQIPMKKIVGTNARSRGTAFARNFMPLLESDTEFAFKWSSLCDSHLEEGIRDPIKCYEFLNRYYVVEGNKRVSVLKYFDAVSIAAEVTRVVPRYKEDDKAIRNYYGFMSFYRITGINYIWFNKEGSFMKILEFLHLTKQEDWTDDVKKEFFSSYTRFEKAYAEIGGKAIRKVTTGDAFFKYITVFGYEGLQKKIHSTIVEEVRKLWDEFVLMESEQPVGVIKAPSASPEKVGFLDRFFGMAPDPNRNLKIGFVHDKDKESSSWTYAHELGRIYLEQKYKGQIETKAVYWVFNQNETPEQIMEQMIHEGYSVIFTTTPRLAQASLTVAVQHPEVYILNCALNSQSSHVRSYYGRLYEPKFLSGMIAGSMSKNGKIGYIADYPISGMLANINAFARGARMMNPDAKVYLEWSMVENVDIQKRMESYGVDVVNNQDMITPSNASRQFGLYQMQDGDLKNISMSIWNWGKLYDNIVRSILSGTWKNSSVETKGKAVNYWWGLSAGVVDLVYTTNLPADTKRLVEFMKKEIRNGTFDPFGGYMEDQHGNVRCQEDEFLSTKQIINMDWLLDNVVGYIPDIQRFSEASRLLMQTEGMKINNNTKKQEK